MVFEPTVTGWLQYLGACALDIAIAWYLIDWVLTEGYFPPDNDDDDDHMGYV